MTSQELSVLDHRFQFVSDHSLLAVTCLWLLAGGCGAGRDSHVQTRKVQGVISVEGRPLSSGTVEFVPEDLKLPGARGEIQADGHYELTTYTAGDGAAVGTHKVLITAYDRRAALPEMTDSSGRVLPNDAPGQAAPKSLVPAQYTNLDSTPLKQIVEASSASQPQIIDLKLKE